MALTLPTGWADAMTRADARPVYYVFVEAGAGANFGFLSGLADATDLRTTPISVVSVSSISQELDPVTRKLSIGTVEVILAMDPNTQTMLSGYRLHGKRVSILVGEKTLPNGTDYQQIFVGYIDEAIPARDVLSLTISSPVIKLKDVTINQEVLNKHPLEIIHSLLLTAGVPAGDIEASTFNPDTDTAISHFCVSRGKGYRSTQDNSIQGELAGDVINQLCELMVGGLVVRETGKIEFKRFNASASTVAIFNDDNIVDIEVLSVYENTINRVTVDIAPDADIAVNPKTHSGEFSFLVGEFRPAMGGKHTQQDDVAAAALGDGTTPYYSEHVITNPWMAGIAIATGSPSYPVATTHPRYPQFSAAATTLDFHVAHIHGFCGMRESWPIGSQPANAKASAGRPVYIKLQTGEIVSSTNFTGTDQASMLIEPAAFGGRQCSAKATATVTRGRLGTTAKTVLPTDTAGPNHASGGGIWLVPAYDITIANFVADTLIERFAYGAPVLRVRTTADQYAAQVGDFVVVTSSELLGFSIEMTIGKWEVVKKEDDLLSDSPGIVWTLVKVERFGAAIDRVYVVNIPPYHEITAVRTNISQVISATAAIDGYSPNSISGLNIKFDPGTLAAQGVILPSTLIDVDLNASKFNYLNIDLMSNLPVLYSAASASPDPNPVLTLPLREIETDGSGILSQTDYRNPTTILGNVVRDATLGPAHQNLLADTRSLAANSDFNIWSLPRTIATQPPDNWQSVIDLGAGYVASPASWGGAVRADTDADVGAYSIRIETDTDPSAISLKQQIPITPDQIYLLEVKVKKSNAAGFFDLVAFYTDGQEIEGDLALAVSDTTTTAGVWEVLRYTFRAQPTAGKKFLNIVFGHQATAGHMLIDFFRLEPFVPSADVRRGSPDVSISSSSFVDVVLNSVAHDTTGGFNTATGQFTITEDGQYSISGAVTIGAMNSGTFIQCAIAVGGTAVRNGTRQYSSASAAELTSVVSLASARLAKGQVITLQALRSSGTASIRFGSDKTYMNIIKVG